jgi:imidazole glycerol-phosphate synthase subunit HisF
LLLKGSGLSKSRRFQDWRYVGDPVNAIRILNQKEVDELVLLDVDATREGRAPRWSALEECAGECFMPLAYGGGIHSVEDARQVVSLGIEKIVVNSAAWRDLKLVSRIADAIGACSTVVCCDFKRNWRRMPRRFSHAEGRATAEDLVEAVGRAVEAGAGEVILQDVDRDGTMAGPDSSLVRAVCDAISVPVTALGGIASLDHAADLWQAGASGVAAGSWFVFQPAHRAVLITYPPYSEIQKKWKAIER